MPRQPFLPTYSRINHYGVGRGSLQKRPELAAIIAQCMEVWANAELQMGLTLGAMLGSQSEAAVAMFLSLRNARARREVISAAANVALSGQELDALEAVLSLYESIGKHRHDLSHGIYGYSDELPDAILWTESSKHSHFLIEVYYNESNNIPMQDRHARMKKDLFVYTKNDLIEIAKLLDSFWWVSFRLHTSMRKDSLSSQEFQNLLSLPLVSKEISRIQEGRKNNPQSQHE